MAATEHVALQPKGDLCFLYGLAHQLIKLGAVDTKFVTENTEGFESFRDHVAQFPPERVAIEAGISVDQLVRVAKTIAGVQRHRSGGLWASTKAIKACEPLKRSSTSL